MPKCVFVRTFEHHPSYYDYWKLVELSGFPTCAPSAVDLQERTVYVYTGTRTEFKKRQERFGNLKSLDRAASLVYYQIERPDSGPGEEDLELGPLQRAHMDRFLEEFDQVWMPYGHLPKLDPRIVYVPMGSHPGLRETPLCRAKQWDLAVLADMRRPARARLAQELDRRWRVAWVANGQERAEVLSSSVAQFVVHQTRSPLPEPQRLAFSAAYELPYLSDTVLDQDPLVDGRDFRSAPLAGILEALEAWMSDRKRLVEIGRNLHERLVVEQPFPESIRSALARLGSR